jgi:6-phosphogluconolactonase (cycloisomerase 2 family)
MKPDGYELDTGRRNRMKFRKFGKTLLTAALSSAIVFSLSSCVRSFTVGYLYVTGTVTSTPSGNGIITGFKIDNDTGKLTALHGLPVGSGGANPVRAVLLNGGRFVYVLNQGTPSNGGTSCTATTPCTNANIVQFAVGGNGVLTPQETFSTAGLNPFRLLSDTSGNYLFALDHDAPEGTYCGSIVPGATSCGDITVFSINSTTGRLSKVVNAQLTSAVGVQVPYFPVPANPIDEAFAGAYVMTLSGTPGVNTTTPPATAQTVYPYSYNATNGQLAVSQSAPQEINNGSGGPLGQASAIIFASGKVYILDNEPITVTQQNGTTVSSLAQILPFTVGTNGALQALVGGATADDPTQSNPIYLIVESKGKYVYVANQYGASSTDAASVIGYYIDPSSNQLLTDPGSVTPTGTGAIPVCLVEDPSSQFIYTANAGDSTVTGHVLEPTTGLLTQMHGTGSGSFSLSGPASWCVVTGRTN